MAAKWRVLAIREYVNRDGEKRSHFFQIGVGFPLRERKGFSCEVWTRLLPTDRFVLMEDDRERSPASGEDAPPDPDLPDDVPF